MLTRSVASLGETLADTEARVLRDAKSLVETEALVLGDTELLGEALVLLLPGQKHVESDALCLTVTQGRSITVL